MASTPDIVRITYRRPPDRKDVFDQRVIDRTPACIVTLVDATRLRRPITVGDTTILEDGSPVIWFTFPGQWHDIGLFHTADGRFTGTYANVLTPVTMIGHSDWETTDLFLDIWLDPVGNASVLDRDEFDDALGRGWISPEWAVRAEREADRLMDRAGRGLWPPAVVHQWSLDRVRRCLEPE